MPTRGRVVVLSAVLALAGAACGSAQQSPSPSAAASASPLAPGPSSSLPPSVAATSPSPSPTAAPASQGPAHSFAKVVADSPLVVRTRPGTDQYSAIIDWRVQPGQKVEVEGGPVDASGYPWYWIRVGARDGWVAGQSRNGQKWLDVSSVTFRPATGWTGPRGVGHDECTITTSAIVVDGALHLAAYCEGSVGYLTNASGKWTATTFPSSGNQSDEGAKLATDGSRLYMAFTRSQPLACGIDYLGVYYRSRALPNGSWSLASRIGPAGDVLQSFQVRGGKLHLTVVGGFYETTAGGSLKRYPLPGATSGASMQVGSDGRARIAYETSGALRYAVFNGSGFDWSAIPGTTKLDTAPGLVLDAQDNEPTGRAARLLKSVGQIKFERGITAFMAAEVDAIAPAIRKKISGPHMKDHPPVFPRLIFRNPHQPPIPAHFVTGCRAVISARDLQRISKNAGGIIIVIAGGFCLAPGGQ